MGFKNKYVIEMNELIQKEFRKLGPFEVEDILCIFKDDLGEKRDEKIFQSCLDDGKRYTH